MKAETMLKRINTVRKDIHRYEKEIHYYNEKYCKSDNAGIREEGCRWIKHYEKLIRKAEEKIAEMSKQAAELATAEEKQMMIKAMAEEMAKHGFKKHGVTTNGLWYGIYWNNGITDRSAHCYSMNIEGMGTVFTSGTLETVAQYILNN